MGGERKKIYGRGANECKMCGRKQGLVRRYHISVLPGSASGNGRRKWASRR